MLRIIIDAYIVRQLAEGQRFAPQVMLRSNHIGKEPPSFQQIENAATHSVIDMLVIVVVALTDHVFDKWRDIEHQFVIKQFYLHTWRDIQFMIAALIVIHADGIRRPVYDFLKGFFHNRLVVVAIVCPKVEIDMLGLPREFHLIRHIHDRSQVGVASPHLVLVNLLRNFGQLRQRGLLAGHIAFVFPEPAFAEIVAHGQLRSGYPCALLLPALLNKGMHNSDTYHI